MKNNVSMVATLANPDYERSQDGRPFCPALRAKDTGDPKADGKPQSTKWRGGAGGAGGAGAGAKTVAALTTPPGKGVDYLFASGTGNWSSMALTLRPFRAYLGSTGHPRGIHMHGMAHAILSPLSSPPVFRNHLQARNYFTLYTIRSYLVVRILTLRFNVERQR